MARFLRENPAAIPVHCFSHSLNLCLQGTGRQIVCIRDALDTVKEIGKLILFSPKRSHLFSSKLQQACDDTVSLKLFCPTRWTARTSAINAILKDYGVLLQTLEEIHATTHDEYGMKANGLLQSLEKFNTLFGLMLSHRLFSAVEQVSLVLQKKNIAIQDALAAVETAKNFSNVSDLRKSSIDSTKSVFNFLRRRELDNQCYLGVGNNLHVMTVEVNPISSIQ